MTKMNGQIWKYTYMEIHIFNSHKSTSKDNELEQIQLLMAMIMIIEKTITRTYIMQYGP